MADASSVEWDEVDPWQPPQRRDFWSGGKCFLACLVAAVVGAGLVVAGLFGLTYFGLSMVFEEAEVLLRENPVVQEHIGELQSLEVRWMESFQHDDPNTFLFDVEGSTGSGVVTAELVTNDEDVEELHSGTLRLPSGEEYELVD